MRLYYYIILATILVFTSCRQDEVLNQQTIDPIIDQVEYFIIEVHGIVQDENQVGLSNTKITVNDKVVMTDELGIFTLDNVQASQYGLHIKAEKEGYFTGGEHVFPGKVDTYKTIITLASQSLIDVFSSENGYIHQDPNGALISIPPNGISSGGQLYSGEVNISFRHFPPEEEITYAYMPGALIAVNALQELQILKTFGMVAVELTDPQGNELNIADGSSASIKFPLQSESLATAPEEIPLWHFDEQNGLWVEEGIANLVGNIYEAEVSHFSWWNCDVPFFFTDFCFTVENEQGVPLQNVDYSMTSQEIGTATGNTGVARLQCKLVPIDDDLTFNIMNSCNEIIYSVNLGSFDNSTDGVYNITIPTDQFEFRTIDISGTAVDCDLNPISLGNIILKAGNQVYFEELNLSNTSYNFSILECANPLTEVTITANSLDALLQETKTIEITADVDNYEVDFTTCESLEEIMTVANLFGDSELFLSCEARNNPTETLITAKLSPDNKEANLILGIKGNTIGEFTGNVIISGISWEDSLLTGQDLDEASFTITDYGEVGGYIVGSGTYRDITIQFSAKRTH